MSGMCRKPVGLGSKTYTKFVVDLYLSVGETRENFHATPDDRAVFENVPSTILQPKVCLVGPSLEVSGGRHWKWCGEAILMSWDCVMLVGLLKAWGSTTLVARSVSSRLPRSASLSADGSRLRLIRPTSYLGQSVTVQRMHSDVDQCETSATGSTFLYRTW